MRLLTKFLFLLNVAVWIFIASTCWLLTGQVLGWVIILGFSIFIISWIVSCEALKSSYEGYDEPEWLIFIKKIKWSNTASIIAMGIYLFICIAFNIFDMREFLHLNAS